MKITLLVLGVLLIRNCLFGQWEYTIDFDSPSSMNNRIAIDSISNPENIWQIGVPNKPIFNNSYSPHKAIVTDTVKSYPSNDTSSFILEHIRPGNLGGNESLQLNFWFKMNSDTLSDFGKVEASVDHGISWIDLMKEDSIYNLYWIDPKPVLTGNSNGWKHFAIELMMLTDELGYSDTLLYRFTFISDSIQTNKDGWMLDEFQLADWWEGVEENSNRNLISIYPNPSTGEISIINNDQKIYAYHIEIIDIKGITVLKDITNSTSLSLDLPSGLYFIKISNTENIYFKRMIIEK